ncbi:hypothetical protein DXH78_07550 [Undibacter mobilis]|uniref:Uncharacterized protein n=2 Tax=Undibacter mobilis TaxID=2292256 RepID=A0A371BA04_9BRAD|nr:hypothetical protein DXH78_07550 [Undibacter mobilis]
MPASQPRSSAPNLARRDILMERVESAAGVAARDHALRIALDESLQALRQETARTLSLVRHQRTTHVYRRAVSQAAL